jgi:hypothetical protein
MMVRWCVGYVDSCRSTRAIATWRSRLVSWTVTMYGIGLPPGGNIGYRIDRCDYWV